MSKRETLLIPHRRGEGSVPLRVGSLDKTIGSPEQLRSLLHLHKSAPAPLVGLSVGKKGMGGPGRGGGGRRLRGAWI